MSQPSIHHRARRLLLLLAGVLLAAGLAACTDTDPAEEEDEIVHYTLLEDLTGDPSLVAVVESEFGTDTLTAQEFENHLGLLEKMFPEVMRDPDQVATIRAGVVDQFVLDHLFAGEAGVRNVVVDPAMVEQQMTQVRTQIATDTAYAALVGDMPEDSIRSEISKQLLPQMLFAAIQDAAPAPSEADVTAFQTEQSQQVRVQHILLLVDQNADEATIESAEERAELLIDSLQAGVDFAELARRHSDDPGSASQGGDLGFFRRGRMVKPFDQAAFALEETGDITEEPVRTTYGFHILRLLDRQEQEVPIEQARSMLLEKRKQDFQKEELNRLRGSATLHVNPDRIDPSRLQARQ